MTIWVFLQKSTCWLRKLDWLIFKVMIIIKVLGTYLKHHLANLHFSEKPQECTWGELAFLLIFLGERLIWPAQRLLKCWRDPNHCYYVANFMLMSLTTEKLGFKDEAILFPFYRCHTWEIFLALSDKLTSRLPYKPKIKFSTSRYWLSQAIFSFFAFKVSIFVS